jgi:3D (Asp-Asp-Asp) domain-containing protein
MRITVERARPVCVARGGEATILLTVEQSVSGVLAKAGVEFGEDDIVVPEPSSRVPESGLVRVVRVTYENVTADAKIPFATERRDDSSIESGLSKVYRSGTPGVSRVEYRVRYEDGVEVARDELSRSQITAPKSQILLVGTLKEVSRGGEAIRFQRAVQVLSTAYCPCTKCCGPNAKGVTRLGLPAKEGIIAVDPRIIPLGSRVYVDGYGYALAADTGSAIRGDRIDVCFSTHEEALRWGMRNLKVYIIE